jgi:hypothetical protein
VADLDDPVLAALAADGDLPLPQVDVAAPRVPGIVAETGQLGQPDAGRLKRRDDRGVTALGEAAACAGMFQPGQLLAGEDGDQLVGDARRLQPGHRVGQPVFGGQPFEELLQGPVLVAGISAAVAVQQPRHPLLDVLAAHLLPAGLPGQVSGGEPSHRLGVGPDCFGGLALGGQPQSERADLRLEYPRVQLLGLLPGTRSWCGHGLGSLPGRTIRSPAFPQARFHNPRDRASGRNGSRQRETRVPSLATCMPAGRGTTDRVGARSLCVPIEVPARAEPPYAAVASLAVRPAPNISNTLPPPAGPAGGGSFAGLLPGLPLMPNSGRSVLLYLYAAAHIAIGGETRLFTYVTQVMGVPAESV